MKKLLLFTFALFTNLMIFAQSESDSYIHQYNTCLLGKSGQALKDYKKHNGKYTVIFNYQGTSNIKLISGEDKILYSTSNVFYNEELRYQWLSIVDNDGYEGLFQVFDEGGVAVIYDTGNAIVLINE